jgi:NADH-quinone oxidoreductase subunit L
LAFELVLILASITAAGLGIFAAWRIWGKRSLAGEESVVGAFPAAHRVLENKYYVDELYDATVIRGFWATARGLYRFDASFIDGFLVNGTRNVTVHALSLGSSLFDKYVVDGLVNLTGRILDGFSRGLRRLQTGYVANYALLLAVGMFVLVCVYMLVLRRG